MNTRNLLKVFLFASVAGKVASGSSFSEISLSLPFRDVTGDLNNCHAATYSRSEVNYKKICSLDGEEYYLKATTDKSLKEAFAREFAINNLQVLAPETEWLYEKDGKVPNQFSNPVSMEKFIASKAIKQYVSAYNLMPSILTIFGFPRSLRSILSDAMGEVGIAKLAVAMSFYNDLHLNNWGVSKGQLVLIDVDTMPDKFSKFIDAAIYNVNKYLKTYLGYLTLDNLKMMKQVYTDMKHRPLPSVHESVDMSAELYESLLAAFSEACDFAIEYMQSHSSDNVSGLTALGKGFIRVSEKYDAGFLRTVKNILF